MARLGLTIDLHPDETAIGYFARLAYLNCRTPYHFGCDIGLPSSSIVRADFEALRQLADFGGVSADALIANAQQIRSDKTIWLRGQIFRPHTVAITRLRYCPLCVKVDLSQIRPPQFPASTHVAQRLHWTISHIRCCHLHDVYLCDEPPTNNPSIDYCFSTRISKRLGDLDRLCNQAPRGLIGPFDTYIASRLSADFSGDQWIDGLELGVVATLSERLGIMERFGVDQQISGLTSATLHECANAGFPIAAEGVETIKQVLHSHARDTLQNTRCKAKAVWGEFYSWLAFTAKTSAFEPVRQILRDQILETIPYCADDIVLGERVGTRGRRTVERSAREAGLHTQRLRKILKNEGLIKSFYGVESVDSYAMRDVVNRAKSALTEIELGKFLGADRVQTKLIIAAAYIDAFSKSGWSSLRRTFERSSAERFLRALKHGAITVDDAPRGAASIATASRFARRPATEIIDLILTRKLSWVGEKSNMSGYSAILVMVDEIRSALVGKPLKGLSCEAFEAKYPIKADVVRKLVKFGYIGSIVEIHPSNRCPINTIPFEEADRFCETYVSLAQIAMSSNVAAKTLFRDMTSRGIRPAFDQSLLGAVLYRRSDLT